MVPTFDPDPNNTLLDLSTIGSSSWVSLLFYFFLVEVGTLVQDSFASMLGHRINLAGSIGSE